MFSCEFFEIFKNTLFTEHLRTTASAVYRVCVENRLILEPKYSSNGKECKVTSLNYINNFPFLRLCLKLVQGFIKFTKAMSL